MFSSKYRLVITYRKENTQKRIAKSFSNEVKADDYQLEFLNVLDVFGGSFINAKITRERTRHARQ